MEYIYIHYVHWYLIYARCIVTRRLKVCHLQSTKGDITVLVSTVKEEDRFEKLVELKSKEFG